MAEERKLPHSMTLQDRRALTMNGVTEVISFDDTAVVLRTSLGVLTVHGRQLQLKTLSVDGGQMAVDGHITALIYQEPKPEGGCFRRLLG